MGKVPVVYDQYSRPDAAGMDFKDSPSRTKAEFAEDADLNVIMRRYTQTGELPESIVGAYGDFSDGIDFQQAQEILARADAQFSALPAEVRARFKNDPGEFLDFVHEPSNYDEARELGLLSKEASARAQVEAAMGVSAVPSPPVSGGKAGQGTPPA